MMLVNMYGMSSKPGFSGGVSSYIKEIDMSYSQKSWEIYRENLYRFIHKRVNDEFVAEDIVHDVLTKAYERRDMLRESDKIMAWLYQIARNLLIDYYRAQRPLDPLPQDLAYEEMDVSSNIIKELTCCVMPFVQELPLHYRQAVMWYEFEGIKQQEIAARLGLSLSGTKSRVQRGRRMLEEKLLACCRFEINRHGTVVDYEPKKRCNAC